MSDKKLNVIYLHTHDSGRIFSPYGYDVPTPRLAQFAGDACLFTQCYCASPTCSPSRSALLTGRYPHSNGMLGLGNRGFGLADYSGHLAAVLGRAGYQTALCGIQHEYGAYSDHAGGCKANGYQQDLTADNTGLAEHQLVEWDLQNANRAAQWLHQAHDQPFFLSMGFFSTHREYPEPTSERKVILPGFLADSPATREDFAGHLESLAHFDRCFGVVLDAVMDAGLYDNTILLFTTDHGIPYPLAKCTLFDAGIGVALLLRVPGAAANGQVCDQLVSQVDIMPTLCALTGAAAKDLQGVDLRPLLGEPRQPVRGSVFAEINFHTSYEPARCIRTQQWKYIRYYDDQFQRHNLSNVDNSISKDYYRSAGLLDAPKPMELLFDLDADPLERHNLADDPACHAALQECRAALLDWQRKTGDYLPDGHLELQPDWRVNRPQCVDPKSRRPEDFLN